MGPDLNLDVMQIWRNDRFGRGGDHTEFLNAGFPAVRFSVAVEDYEHQHQDLRIENGIKYGDTVDEMDFPYLARVTKLNVAALAWLASAPPPPEPTVEGAVSTDTTVTWNPIPGIEGYVVYKRRTDASNWEPEQDQGIYICPAHNRLRPGYTRESCLKEPIEQVLKGIRVDDWVFGVSSVGANGFESPVASAVPGGAFKPYVEPEAKSPSP